MSELQMQAVQLIRGLSDDDISFLIEIIQRLMPQESVPHVAESSEMQAFRRLDAARAEIREYLSDDFDPERELEEARAERYGHILRKIPEDFLTPFRNCVPVKSEL